MRPNARTISSESPSRARADRASRDARARPRAPWDDDDVIERRARGARDVRRDQREDVEGALERVDDDVGYEDFNFPSPFVGKAAVRALFIVCRGRMIGPSSTSAQPGWYERRGDVARGIDGRGVSERAWVLVLQRSEESGRLGTRGIA